PEKDAAGSRGFQPADHVERGGFAAARRPQQPDELAVRHLEAEVFDSGGHALGLAPAGRELFGQSFQRDFHTVHLPAISRFSRIQYDYIPFAPPSQERNRLFAAKCGPGFAHRQRNGKENFCLPGPFWGKLWYNRKVFRAAAVRRACLQGVRKVMTEMQLLALEASDATVVITGLVLVMGMLVVLCLIIMVEGKLFDRGEQLAHRTGAPRVAKATQ